MHKKSLHAYNSSKMITMLLFVRHALSNNEDHENLNYIIFSLCAEPKFHYYQHNNKITTSSHVQTTTKRDKTASSPSKEEYTDSLAGENRSTTKKRTAAYLVAG